MAEHPEFKRFDQITEKRISEACLNEIQELRAIYQSHNCACHPRLDLAKVKEYADVLGMLAMLLHDECMTIEASIEKVIAVPVTGGEPEIRDSMFSQGILKSMVAALAYMGEPRCRKAYAVGKNLLPSNITPMRICSHVDAAGSRCTYIDNTDCNGLKFECPAYRQKT